MIPFKIRRTLQKIPANEAEAIHFQEDTHQWMMKHPKQWRSKIFMKESPSLVAAVDISYPNTPNPSWGIAGLVLWDFSHNVLVKHLEEKVPISFPYIPGCLGFRESLPIYKLLQKIKIKPDLLICDGHGRIHPRYFGEAVHLGLLAEIPSIGVAKNPYYGTISSDSLGVTKGTHIPIFDPRKSGEILGVLLRNRTAGNPVYVSIGIGLSLKTAIKSILELSADHRLPEPLYWADRYSRLKINQ